MSATEEYMKATIARIESAKSCDTLRQISADAISDINDMIASVAEPIKVLKPLIELNPIDLSAVIDAVKQIITVITGPYAALVAEEAYIMAQATEIATKIQTKISSLKC